MLRSLQIRNIAVIKSADIEFGDSFCVLTGQTGAGKSIIIDSILMLMGNKTSKELIRSGETCASVTAYFENLSDEVKDVLKSYGIDCEDDELLLTRSITNEGRSSARINGNTVTQSILREVSSMLISVHGQHDNQKLMQKSIHIILLDEYADISEKLKDYRIVYNELKKTEKELSELKKDETEKLRLRDILDFQIKEIDRAKLVLGEEEELIAERTKYQYAEKIEKQTGFVYKALYAGDKINASVLIDRSISALGDLVTVIPEMELLKSRLEECKYEIDDIADTVNSYTDGIEDDPTEKLDFIEGRLDLIKKLEKKYGIGIDGILKFRKEAAKRLSDIDNIDNVTEDLSDRVEELKKSALSVAHEISAIRKAKAKEAAQKVMDNLTYLDMPGVRFEIKVTENKELNNDGIDDVEFMIAANPGEEPVPLAKTASGGELSRVMLALKCVLSGNIGIDTMIFDEVDTGISGRTSRKVGVKLHNISENTQVLCVTHSAQIASLADTHLLISKNEVDGRSETVVKNIEGEERVCEIARILGGINITEKQKEAAREMIIGTEIL